MNLNDLRGNSAQTDPMPVVFLGHGSPMNAIEQNEFSTAWQHLGKTLPRPRAVLCISAHWETRGTYVTAMPHPKTIHDFGGFPKELYEVQYPAPGSPELAKQTLGAVHYTTVGLDSEWGLDHGCWSVMRHLYPDADVPVVQLSLDYYQNAQYHYDLAKDLSSLRHHGILILGSGNMVHNLRMAAWDRLDDTEYGYDWALEARAQMNTFILNDDHQSLIHYQLQGRAFQLAIPTPEHFLPLLCVLALKGPKEKVTLFNDKAVAGSLTMTSLTIDKA